MLMATFQASLRALASASGSLSELVGGLSRQVCANSQNGRFTTAFRMEPHDLLVIYTDGVTEARSEEQEEFGEARLLAQLQVAGGERSALTLSNIMQNLDEFVGAAPQHDDITCMVVHRN
jgi:phosphoserine phosphatase RsbU/P